MDNPELIWFLMARNLSGEATPAEQQQLTALLQEQPHLQQQYELLRQLWKQQSVTEHQPEPAKISRILQLSAVEEALQPPTRNTQIRKFWWAAAAAVLLVAGFLTWQHFNKSITDSAGVIVAQKGTKTRTILPDGSTVLLNAGSRIEYDPAFNHAVREITLFGEAFFDVVKQPDRPFIVHAGNINIRVLGTAFNVKSYPEEKTVETTLIRGLVQITTSGNTSKAPIYLHPNQKIILPAVEPAFAGNTAPPTKTEKPDHTESSPIAAITLLDTTLKENEHIETAWVYNRLQFRGDSFAELASKLERWYNISIQFEDNKARLLTFNGSIENETLEQAFKALQTAVPFKFKIDNNEVFISSP